MKLKLFSLALCALSVLGVNAQDAKNLIYVNPEVTTHIVMPEMLKLVDISTPVIAGNQCTDNMVRIKPLPNDSLDHVNISGDFLGTVTLIGERHMVQYDVIYTSRPQSANSIYNVGYAEMMNYVNPEVSMPESEMARFAWSIYGSPAKFHGIRANKFGIDARINNIYSIGNYFFIDMTLKNNTKIGYDIAEMRVKLTDKKEVKATNSQTIELMPVYTLNKAKCFQKDYHQVFVIDRLTFPNEKILTIEVAENQISGRVITLAMEYEDVLNADIFDLPKAGDIPVKTVIKRETIKVKDPSISKELTDTRMKLSAAHAEIEGLNKELKKSRAAYKEIKAKFDRIVSKSQAILEAVNMETKSSLPSESTPLPDESYQASLK